MKALIDLGPIAKDSCEGCPYEQAGCAGTPYTGLTIYPVCTLFPSNNRGDPTRLGHPDPAGAAKPCKACLEHRERTQNESDR